MSNLKWRLIGIGVLSLLSAIALFPRNRTIRLRDASGVLRETVQRHVPLHYGLDLQGGMHLTLEVDESKQAVADKSEAIDRALKTVRNRVEGIGVSEPVIQKVGADRIIVDLPGEANQDRATQIVQSQAFLEFKITDNYNSLEKVLPRLDAVIKERKLTPIAAAAAAAPASARGLESLLRASDTGKKADTAQKTAAKKDTSRADSLLASGGALSNLLQQGNMPGEYLVESDAVARVTMFLEDSAVKAALPPAKSVLWGTDSTGIPGKTYKTLYVLESRPIMTGEHLIDARPNTSPLEGTIVQFKMDNVGGLPITRPSSTIAM